MLNSPQVSEDSSLPSPQSSTLSQITPAVTQLPFLHSNSSSVHPVPKTEKFNIILWLHVRAYPNPFCAYLQSRSSLPSLQSRLLSHFLSISMQSPLAQVHSPRTQGPIYEQLHLIEYVTSFIKCL